MIYIYLLCTVLTSKQASIVEFYKYRDNTQNCRYFKYIYLIYKWRPTWKNHLIIIYIIIKHIRSQVMELELFQILKCVFNIRHIDPELKVNH